MPTSRAGRPSAGCCSSPEATATFRSLRASGARVGPVGSLSGHGRFAKDEMKIAIVGTGAMGSVYASLLGKAGHEVWAIDIWQEHIDVIAASGLSVSGASGRFVVDNLHVGRAPHDAGTCDVWMIATKAADVDVVAADIAP